MLYRHRRLRAACWRSLVAGLLGRQIGDRASQAVTILCMTVAAICGSA